jgi:beta-N-acetylhexosaminidase
VDVASWTLSRVAAQLVAVPVAETDVAAAAPLVSAGVGGLVLFGDAAPPTLGADLHQLDALARRGIRPAVMADEEGGGVQRLANAVGSMPWARTMAETMTPVQVQQLAATVGRRMRAVGVTMDLAPVLDVDARPGPSASDADGARSFSANPTTATNYGLAFARGLLQSGVTPVVKHFPGLGHATYNTDLGPAYIPPLDQLRGDDLIPFERAIHAGMPAVMVSHAIIPGLTTGPASLSTAVVTGLLRNQLGFHGLVVTDSLSALAVSHAGYSVTQAAVRAVAAGDDLLLYGPTSYPIQVGEQIVSALATAVRSGQLSRGELDRAAVRVLAVKHLRACG